MNFISASLYYKVLNQALSEGLDNKAVAHLKIPEKPVNGPHVLPADVFFELHEIVDRELQAGLSVRVGHEMKMDDYGVLGLSWKTISTGRELYERFERYFVLLTNTYLFKLEDKEEVTKIYLDRDAYRRGVELSNESTLTATIVVLKAITETDIEPLELAFKHGPPRDLSSYSQLIKCPLKFNQESNYISYLTSELNSKTAKADQSINRFLQERIDEEARGIEINAHQITLDVKQLIKDALPSGIPSIQQIGEHIGMSPRTLTRRLSDSGYSFRDLVKMTQEEISSELLRSSSRSVAEIAFQTGFSEQSAFNRAFKRWKGQSPVEYRKTA